MAGNDVSIGIVGGGIGGLAAALSLLRAGLDVHVYEQAGALGEVGAGIHVSPNASRVLHGLGLAGEQSRRASRAGRRWSSTRWSEPTGSTRRCAKPFSARRRRGSQAASRTAASCPSHACAPSTWKSSRRCGWARADTSRAASFRNRRLVNFVAIVDRDTWTRESWTDRGDVAEALAAFEGWHPQVGSILGAVDETFAWALFDRAPLERWSVGHVTLLGDACHPMLPFMAQGAAQAIEDGATLAGLRANAGPGGIPEALQRYQQLRLTRTTRVRAASASNKTRFHLPDGPAQRQRDAEMASEATDWSIEAVAWLYGHDAGTTDGGGPAGSGPGS